MILRFCSGSVTPASRSRNSVDASTNTSGSFRRSNRRRICSASSRRSTPLSTKMHVSRSPIARWMSSAATVESTPPLKPQTTRPSPTCRANLAGRLLDKRRHRPVAGAAADVVREVAQDLEAAIGVRDFRMKEQRVEPPLLVRHRRDRSVGARRDHLRSPAARSDEVAVARPHAQVRRDRREQSARRGRCTSIVACPNSRCGAGATRRRARASSAACRSRCPAPARRRRRPPGSHRGAPAFGHALRSARQHDADGLPRAGSSAIGVSNGRISE